MRGLRSIAGPLALVAAALAAAPAARASRPPAIEAPAAIVIDAHTGERLYARHADDRRAIASTTKLMTALITLERTHPGEVFAMPPYRVGSAESRLGLRTGERMTVHDLLEAMMLPSANDAAYDLAINIGGTKGRFVRLMNARARALGLTETHYSTPVGLDDPRNYSSASDLARLAALLLRNPALARVVNMGSAHLRSGARPRTVMNRNTLVRRYPFVDGVKTGHTLRAGYVLVGAAHAHGAEIVSVVMGTPSEYARDSDSLALLRWGAAQFTRVAPVHAGRRYGRAAVRWRDGETAALVAARPVRLTVRRGERTALKVDAPRRLQGPLRRGSRVGTLAVVLRGRVVARVPLVTASAVRGVSFLQRATGPLGGPLAALALVALVGTMALLGRRMARTNRGMRRQRAG